MTLELTPEEERDVELSAEARRRAAARIREDERKERQQEAIAEACKNGKHEPNAEGKCKHCGVAVIPELAPKKKGWFTL